jgi:glycosyltransferase involved in cell wall biosynthesis
MLGEYLDMSLPWFDLAQNMGIRFFAHAHGYDVSERLRDPHFRREYLRYVAAAGVITMSETNRRRLIDLGLPADRVHTIPYGVDVPDVFEERASADTVRLVAVGRMVAKKSPLSILSAFKRAAASCPGITLDYIGEGPLFQAAVDFVAASDTLAGHISLLGARTNAEVLDRLRDADIFVQHSITDRSSGDEEGLPVAILEAMAAGLPVIATVHAGIPEAVEDGTTGYLVEEGDVDGTTERIVYLARHPEVRSRMGRAGWRAARDRFSWARERAELLRVMSLAP